MGKIGLLVVGGATGTLARYLVSVSLPAFLAINGRWGVAGVNVLGGFLIGVAWVLLDNHLVPSDFRWVFVVGFLGAFTTFSTYLLDQALLVKSGHFAVAIGYFLLSNLGGGLAVLVGAKLGTLFLR